MINGVIMTKPIPKINKPEYRVIFYHKVTGCIMKYKFSNHSSAVELYNSLDKKISKPTMYKIKRIL